MDDEPRLEIEDAALRSSGLVERRGIDYIASTDRHGRPADLFWMWAGALVNVQTVAFGALVLAIGLNLTQSLVVIVIANVSWISAGLVSLTGPAAGTTALTLTRASFGPRGGRVTAVLNWGSMVIFEIATIVLGVFAAIVIMQKAGLGDSTGVKLAAVIIIGVLQFCLPMLGHTAILKTLKALTLPFVFMFIVMFIVVIPKLHTITNGKAASFPTVILGFAVALSVTGFSFMTNAPDYSRYLPVDAPKKNHVVAVTLGGLLPMVPLMCLGAALATISNASDPISGLSTIFPNWFIVPYLIFAIVQVLCLTSVDLYSSGLSLLAAGLRIRRTTAAAIDCVICAVVGGICVFYSVFFTLISNMLLFNMVWLAPWGGVVIVDYFMRRGQYDVSSLFDGRHGRYWGKGGFRVAAMVALACGIVISLLTLDTTVYVGPLSNAMGGADLSILSSFFVGAVVYYILARGAVHAEAGMAEAVAAESSSPAVASALVSPRAVTNGDLQGGPGE